MHTHYVDILSRISEAPQWYDENAVPRFCVFEPKRMANIYARESALMEINCQGCRHQFPVALSEAFLGAWWYAGREPRPSTLAELIRNHEIHYGDPPNIRCCDAGPTMNSVPRRILEYWRRIDMKWTRDSSLEIELKVDWD